MKATRLQMRHQPDRATARNLWASNGVHGERGDASDGRVARVLFLAMFLGVGIALCVWEAMQ